MNVYVLTIICVIGISIGQLLFKQGAIFLKQSGNFFDVKTFSVLFLALALYGITTIGWIWILRTAPLNKAYPFMAIAFVLVPIGGYLIFSEAINIQYIIGITMIVSGVVLTTSA